MLRLLLVEAMLSWMLLAAPLMVWAPLIRQLLVVLI